MEIKVSISIGEYYASKEPAAIYTLLGSCIAVSLFDPVNRIGGMNHILMPGKARLDNYDGASRFGVNSMELLINALMKLGADRSRIVAKVFGGASVIPGISSQYAIGPKITRFIVDFLANEKIRIINKDLGGIYTRRIFFHTNTGDVFMKRSRSLKSSLLTAEEQKNINNILMHVDDPSEITYF